MNKSLNFMNSVQVKRPGRNKFDLSHDKKLSFDMGQLIPVLCQEVIPGDRFEVKQEHMIRFAPMIAPVMHRFDVTTHFFFVPWRILWSSWEEFITGSYEKTGDPAPVFPTIRIARNSPGKLLDYMGMPTSPAGETFQDAIDVNAMIPAAYGKIWNEFYRDQNLQAELPVDCFDGGSNDDIQEWAIGGPKLRNYKHDYFTACLPWASAGPQVAMPISGIAPIEYTEDVEGIGFVTKLRNPMISGHPPSSTGGMDAVAALGGAITAATTPPDDYVSFDNSRVLRANLDNVVSTTINDFRMAMALQSFYEINARGGTRYSESIYAHFGVRSSDSRLQRPEYLGGGKSPVVISEVLQTSGSPLVDQSAGDPVGTPQGNLAGHGINVGETHYFNREFEEHGIIIGLMSVMPEAAYTQGLPKLWSKFDKFDYFWPQLANIGEQGVLNKELFMDAPAELREQVFGFLPAYSDYRTSHSTVHGDFRETLDYWHLGRQFANTPVLSEEFIEMDPTDSKRIFAVQDIPEGSTEQDTDSPVRKWNALYAHVFNRCHATRSVPMYGTPAPIV